MQANLDRFTELNNINVIRVTGLETLCNFPENWAGFC